MKRNDIKALHEKTVEELQTQLETLRKEYALEKLNHRANQKSNPGKMKIMRKDMARLQTILTEKRMTESLTKTEEKKEKIT